MLLNYLKKNIDFCSSCYNITDSTICQICSNIKRNKQIICVVQDIRDVMAIESTGQYFGLYHVLGGIISPMDGIGPEDLRIKELIERVKS